VPGEVGGVPLAEGFSDSLPELVNDGLGNEAHGHLAVSDVQVEGKQVKRCVLDNMLEQGCGEMLGIGEDQGLVGFRLKDRLCQVQQFRCGLGDGARATAASHRAPAAGRAVRRIEVEYAATKPGDPDGGTNVVRPLYHVAWLASRLGMSVVSRLRREGPGPRVATLRQSGHEVEVVLTPAVSKLPDGSTVRVEITSRLRGAEVIGTVEASDRSVDVQILDNGRERVRRSYAAPRLKDADLLGRAVEEGAADPVSVHALSTAGKLLGVESATHKDIGC